MLNIAVAATFVLSFFLSPGQRLVGLFIEPTALNVLEAGQRGVMLALFGYWLPATILYTILRFVPWAARFRPTTGETWVMTLGNLVIVLYIAVRIFASTVEGGGASFVVASYSIVTALPALAVLCVALIRIAIRGLQVDASLVQTRPAGFVSYAAIAVFGVGPVAYAASILTAGADSPFLYERAVAQRMSQRCATAGERFFRAPENVASAFFSHDGALTFSRIAVTPMVCLAAEGSAGR